MPFCRHLFFVKLNHSHYLYIHNLNMFKKFFKHIYSYLSKLYIPHTLHEYFHYTCLHPLTFAHHRACICLCGLNPPRLSHQRTCVYLYFLTLPDTLYTLPYPQPFYTAVLLFPPALTLTFLWQREPVL